QYEGLHAPFTREGVALFERSNAFYMLTSGMTGYVPNKSDSAIADTLEHPFKSIGDPHVNDKSQASFNSQISQVFRVQGKKDLYIAIADRWLPDIEVDAQLADIMERAIASHYDPENYKATPEEQRIMQNTSKLEHADTSASTYVWLPLQFDGTKVQIQWRDAWTIEEFE
ncbi:MAG: hypothetical protein Q4B22_03700, partial [Eubacteriales bacterium]|nr:hypothetical protein [Eubacteriales bacterium]